MDVNKGFNKNLMIVPKRIKMPYLSIIIWSFVFLFSVSFNSIGQTIVINEVVSSNVTINKDEEGDREDWVELYNSSEQAVSLKGYGLSDDPGNLLKWQFPEVNLLPNEHLLIWASGKDRTPAENQVSNGLTRKVFKGIQGGQISYMVNYKNYPNNPSFEEPLTGFFEVPANDGDEYGQRIEGHILPPVSGEYTFWISGDDICQLFLSTSESADDAVRIAELGSATGVREWNRHSSQKSQKIYLEGGKYYYIYALMKDIDGSDHMAVRWQLPDGSIEEPIPDTRLFVIEKELHTNFKIKASGEALYLSDLLGQIIDTVGSVELPDDYAYGRLPDGAANWDTLYLPSPQLPNPDKVFKGWCENPEVSIGSGFYSSSFQVSMSSNTPGAKIYYTTDCSVPTQQSLLYAGPIRVNRTRTIRARAFSDDLQPSQTITGNYFLYKNHTFPVVSITTDPYNLYNPDHGIFIQTNPYWESNLFQDWERPVNIQLFENNQSLSFEINAGLKVHGGLTRGQNIKSLAIMARSIYGQSKINYRLFEDKNIDKYNNVLFRNGGNDCAYAIIRDAYMHEIIRGQMDLDLSASRPAIVYLNGNYWGIHNIREKLNEHFIAVNHKIDPDNVDLLEYKHHNTNVLELEGNASEFNSLIDYIKDNDLEDSINYEFVNSRVDINNFIEYQTAQIYFDNGDWPGNNIKWWKQSDAVGKWRWLLFDTDFGFGLSPFGNEQGDELLHYKHNTLALAMQTDGEAWPNPPHSTFLFLSLLKNESFKHQFINTFCDHLNSTFKPNRVTGILDTYKQMYEVEVGKHRQSFSGKVNWHNEIAIMKTFGELRPQYIYPHLMTGLNLTRNQTIALDVNNSDMGDVGINSLTCSDYPWEGEYFPNVPLQIRAIPKYGYRFVRWSDNSDLKERTIDVGEIPELTAYFERDPEESVLPVICQINYKASPGYNAGDWVALFNNSDLPADLSHWVIKDSDDNHSFYFPEGTLIEAKSTLVICADSTNFIGIHVECDNVLGNMDFGFSDEGEILRLYSPQNKIVDWVSYGVKSPWPILENPDEVTIKLIDPNKDNNKSDNWHVSSGTSPCNYNYINVDVKQFPIVTSKALKQNYPNPFTDYTTIKYEINTSTDVCIQIIDMTGRIVNTLVNGHHAPGQFSFVWNGENSNGKAAKGNVFVCQIITSVGSETIMLMKM